MSKRLHSLLEMAIVIGGLSGAPLVVLATLAPVPAAAHIEQAPVAVAQDAAAAGPHAIELRF